jgi:hypothetical protein
MQVYRVGQSHIHRVGQICIYTPYTTVYLVISLQNKPSIDRIFMVLPTLRMCYVHHTYMLYTPYLTVRMVIFPLKMM